MKTLTTLLIALTLTFASQAAHATSMPYQPKNQPSAEKVADLLSSSKVAPCLAKLHALENTYEVIINQLETRHTANDEQSDTVISYGLLQGGDMMMGEATITIRTQLYSGLFPEMGKVERVIGCKFGKRTY